MFSNNDYLRWLKEQQANGIPNMPQATAPNIERPEGGFVTNDGMDPAIKAMLGIQALSPKERALARKRAQAQQLRNVALDDNARHWTGVLAQGLAGGMSGYQDRKIDPQEEALNAERQYLMRQLGLRL